jgi:LAS seventeen-binding protein 1/2
MANNAAYINRSLTTIHNELEFLKDSRVISEAFYEQWSAKLPKKYTPGAPPIEDFTSPIAEKQEYRPPSGPPSVPQSAPAPSYSPQGEEIAETLYDYQVRDPTDLPLQVGRRLVVLEHLNPDWWRGRDIQTGREGIFPSNYVRVIEGEKQRAPVPVPYGAGPISPVPSNPYYPPPSTNYYQNQGPSQPMQQEPVVVEAQPQQQHHTSDAFKKFGSKLGNAAIFGAGATLGGDLVNSIL